MPALATVSLADGQTTPVAHAFTPVGIMTDGTAVWSDRDHTTPVGFFRMTQKLRQPIPSTDNTSPRVYRFVEKISMPIVATVDGVETKVGENTAEVIFVLSEASSEQQRKDLRHFVRNSLYVAPASSAIDTLEGTW